MMLLENKLTVPGWVLFGIVVFGVSIGWTQGEMPRVETENLLHRLQNARQEEGLAFPELLQLMRQLQMFRAPEEALAVFGQMLETDEMQRPETRFQQALQMGRFLEQSGRADLAVDLYQDFLDWLSSGDNRTVRAYRDHVRSVLLSAMIGDGRYRQARRIAGEILEATEEPLTASILGSLLDLADYDFFLGDAFFRIEEEIFENSRLQGFFPRLLRLSLRQGRVAKAAQLTDRILREHPSTFLSSIDLAYEIYTEAAGETGGAERIFSLLDEMHRQGENQSLYDLIRVRWLDRSGRTDEAIELLEKQPEHLTLFQNELAALYLAQQDYERAGRVLENLLRLQPNNLDHLRQLGRCRYLLGRESEAVRLWKQIPARLGGSANSYMELADIFQQYGLTDEAMETLRGARRRFGPAVDLQIEERILDLWMEQEEWDRLLRQYLSFSLENSSSEVRFRRRLIDQAQSPERAKALFAAVQARMPEEVDAVRRKFLMQLGADLLLESGQPEQAVDFVTESFRDSSELGIRLYTLGMELENRGETISALEAWSRVPETASFYHQARFQMATTSLYEKQFEMARQGALGLIQHMAQRYVPSAVMGEGRSATLSACLNRLQGHPRETFRKALLVLAEVDLEKKQPGRALHWISVLTEHPSHNDSSRLALLEGHAYSQLGSLDMAEQKYRKARNVAAPGSLEAMEAGYFLAECLLWREKTPEALNAYFDLAEGAPEAPYSNEAIRRYLVVSFAGAQQLHQYSLATLFEWRGNWEEAVRLYREAASHESDREIAGWCLYEAARLLHRAGQEEASRRQIELILENYEHPTLLAESRVLLARLSGEEGRSSLAGGSILDATGPYVDLLLEHPDSLYADLVRLKMDGRLEAPF